jgi:hypothetical protein
MATFVREAVQLAEKPLGGSRKQFQVLVQFTCRPDGHDVELAYQGDAPQDRLQQYFDALTATKRLPLSDGELSFQIELIVNGQPDLRRSRAERVEARQIPEPLGRELLGRARRGGQGR